MFEYTFENHFQFGYLNGSTFSNRVSPGDTFVASYGKCRTQISSWREANRQACIDIAQKSSSQIYILFSGGTDSEICIRSFIEAEIPFKIATLRFTHGLNSHDLYYVEKLKQELNLPVSYFDLDILDFWESNDFYNLVDRIQCVSPILACHLWLADQLDGLPIIAQGEPHLKKEIPSDYIPGHSPYLPSKWNLLESERLCSLYKHFSLQGRPAIPGFFQFLPEQIYTYLTANPLLQDLVQNKVIGKLGTRSSKNLMAQQFYPELTPRQKFTGYEKIEEQHDKKRSELASRFPDSDQVFSFEYNELVKNLAPSGAISNGF